MTRFERVRVIAAKQGVSLAEYLLLHIATAFAMTPDEAVEFLTKTLAKTPYADGNGEEALRLCTENGWVAVSCANFLQLTEEGRAMVHVIAKELTAPTDSGEGAP
jgi:hypothetical protein